MIEVKNVTKTYGLKDNLFTALKDISFVIEDGSSVAILGKSGSGKSTLMHVMSGLDKPESGEIVVDGKNIINLRPSEVDKFRSKSMGFIFQSFFVQANESCYDNVSLPLEIARTPSSRRRKRIESALKAVELHDKIKSKVRDLSGGQKQRLAVARAIVNKPRFLFADEPTGNLDSVTGAVIENLLFDYNKKFNVTLIIVTHNPDLANRCDVKIHITDGKIDYIRRNKR